MHLLKGFQMWKSGHSSYTTALATEQGPQGETPAVK